jgi:hypothetical protein
MGVQGGGSNEMDLLLRERCKLDRMPLDEGARPRRGRVRCLLHGVILEGNVDCMIFFNLFLMTLKRAHFLENHFGR